jgi:SAM-dependent methyltransferase
VVVARVAAVAMTGDDPALFYTGIVAIIYGPLRSSGKPDPAPYARFIERSGQPALELGCGFGEPLLDLCALGFDVEGLDASPDMVELCRANAASRGLTVVVHEQRMQDLAIDRKFSSIFLAGPTFNLLPDDETALQALVRIREHLAPGGSLLLPLFIPRPTPAALFGRSRRHVTDEGVEMLFSAVTEERDPGARVQTTMTRYELRSADETLVEQRPWTLHWYRQEDIRSLVAEAGLSVARVLGPGGGPAHEDDDEFTLIVHQLE